MKLSIGDRLQLGSFLPEKGNIFTMKFVKELQVKVDFSVKEMKDSNLKGTDDGMGYTWDSKTKPKEFSFTGAELDILKEGVARLDNASAITNQTLDLALRIKEAKVAEKKTK